MPRQASQPRLRSARSWFDLKGEHAISVIQGDQATLNDAQRIRATGAPVIQINTGTGCHLEADMLARGLQQLDPPPGSMLMIENVGNLVCPALFDLGEHAKVVILSVTEGEDKPVKYPHMFRASALMLLSKVDLLPTEKALETAVGIMLVLLGADVLRRLLRERVHFHVHRHAAAQAHVHAHSHRGEGRHAVSAHAHAHPPARWPLRALAVGVMHRLAGSAALVVLSLEAVPSVGLGLGYIAIFGVGSILGMALLSVVMAVPLKLSASYLNRVHRAMSAMVAGCSALLGGYMVWDIGYLRALLLG